MLLGIYLPFGEEIKNWIKSHDAHQRSNRSTNIQQCGLSQPDRAGLESIVAKLLDDHPSTFYFRSFCPYRSTFGYAAAALRKNSFEGGCDPVFSLALFGTAILGISLTMGSRLGLWSIVVWRLLGLGPVENTSLVPWIVLVGGIHQPYCQSHRRGIKSPGFSTLGAFDDRVFYLLTRSGILGILLLTPLQRWGWKWRSHFGSFLVLGAATFLYRYKDHTDTRQRRPYIRGEFWMYVGSLVLFSAVLINASSSLPVLNTIVRTWCQLHGKGDQRPIPALQQIPTLDRCLYWYPFRIHRYGFPTEVRKKPGKRFWMLVSLYVLVAAIFTGLTTI